MSSRKPRWDAKAISAIAKKPFGSFPKMFEYHGWPGKGDKMMLNVQRNVATTYGSIQNFLAKYPVEIGG